MNLFFKYKQDAVMNINRCCREPEQDFPEGYVNQQVTDFLSGMTKKKKENKKPEHSKSKKKKDKEVNVKVNENNLDNSVN